MSFDAELHAALEAARLAGARIMELYAAFPAMAEAPANITTQADHESQEIVLQYLRAKFPGDALRAEEKTPTLAAAVQEGRRMWIVDPIDGTRGFATKNDEFSVMIALIDGDSPVVGVVYEPAKDRLTYASLGQGCYAADGAATATRRRVSPTAALADARLTQSRSKPGVTSRQVTALSPASVVETHSAGVKLALVARGEADLYVNHYPNFADWDICAGHILVTEAGGTVTGLRGQAIAYGKPGAHQRLGLIATNGVLHAETAARLEGVF